MNDHPAIVESALRLDPFDQDALQRFHQLAQQLLDVAETDRRDALANRISSSIQALALASISSEPPIACRAELVAASTALDKAAKEHRTATNTAMPMPDYDPDNAADMSLTSHGRACHK